MMHDMTYETAIAKAEHLIALGETTVYLRDKEGFPYSLVNRVESGSAYRLSGPSSCYLIAEQAGITFKLNVDFEGRDANGAGVSMFDRDRLRAVMLKLPPAGQEAFAKMLEGECLSGMAARTEELRAALRTQADSEDCVRGLIASARQMQSA